MPINKPRFKWIRERPHRIVAWLQSHERTASWLGAVFTGLIFFVTAVYATVAYFQMRAMNATVQQTKTLIEQQKESLGYAKLQADAAKTSADAAKVSADAAKTQADSMKEQSGTLKDSLAETRKAANAAVTQANASLSQAGTSKISAEAVRESTQITKEARRPVILADISLGSVTDDEIQFQIKSHNDSGGNTDFTLKYCLMTDPAPNPNHTLSECPADRIINKGSHFLATGNSMTTTVRVAGKEQIQPVRSRAVYLFLLVLLSYEDYGQLRQRQACGVYREDFKVVGDCNDLVIPQNQNPKQKPN